MHWKGLHDKCKKKEEKLNIKWICIPSSGSGREKMVLLLKFIQFYTTTYLEAIVRLLSWFSFSLFLFLFFFLVKKKLKSWKHGTLYTNNFVNSAIETLAIRMESTVLACNRVLPDVTRMSDSSKNGWSITWIIPFVHSTSARKTFIKRWFQ